MEDTYCYKKQPLGNAMNCSSTTINILEGNCTYYTEKCNFTQLDNGCLIFNADGTLNQKGEGNAAYLQFRDNTVEPFLKVFVTHPDEPKTSIMELKHHDYLSGKYNLKLQKEVTKRLPAPHISKCTVNGANSDNTLPNRYTRRNCYSSCMVRRIFEECEDVMDHMSHYITDEMKARVTTKNESKIRDCLDKVWKDRRAHDLPPVGCNCPYACDDILYKYQFEKWEDLKTFKDNTWDLYIRFTERSITYITQEPLHTIPDVLSNLGGFMGLLAGLSVLSLAEILLFVVMSFARFVKGCLQ